MLGKAGIQRHVNALQTTLQNFPVDVVFVILFYLLFNFQKLKVIFMAVEALRKPVSRLDDLKMVLILVGKLLSESSKELAYHDTYLDRRRLFDSVCLLRA